jgi:adenylate cyclase
VAALSHLNEVQRAKDWARRALLVAPENVLLRHNIACSIISIGEFDMAFELLENQVMKYSEGLLIWMGRDSDFDAVRTHPRFVDMMERAHARVAACKSAEQ